jgi:hypothetical protein
MKKILLSNIGNRNLKIDGKNPDLKNNNGKNFKDFTRECYESLISDYNLFRPRITLEILTNFISETDQVVIFATEQESEFNHQDTVFEAQILKLILEKEEQKKVNILIYRGNPTDEFSTYRYFSSILKEFRHSGSDEFYIVNDAGGTPHMKQALKDLCEFYFPGRHSVVYTNQKDQKNVVNRWGGKKYVLLATLAEFVKNHDYRAAAFLVKILNDQLTVNDISPVAEELITYIDIASHRINFDRKNAQSPLLQKETPKQLRGNQILQKFIQSRSFELSCSIPFDQMSAKAKHDIFEIASICQLYFIHGNYTLAIATLYRFMEEICQSFIESEGIYSLETGSARRYFKDAVSHEITSSFRNVQPSEGLPLYLGYVSIKAEKELKKLIDLFRELTSHVNESGNSNKGLNLLRNRCFLAHNNKPITEEILNQEFPNLLRGERWKDQIFDLCNMPKKNIYDQMNEEILELIFNE